MAFREARILDRSFLDNLDDLWSPPPTRYTGDGGSRGLDECDEDGGRGCTDGDGGDNCSYGGDESDAG